MANFLPLKNYIFYCIDKLVDQYKLSPPFLDVGCGIGDISQHVALKGWSGKAIDFSDIAIANAKLNLASHTSIEVEKKSLFHETGTYNTIFLMDVLEHIEDDNAALEKISSLLPNDGYVVIVVPSNPKEWRWDDDFYGHHRRYTKDDIENILNKVNLKPLVTWDFTYPFFWIMRRAYTRLKSTPKNMEQDKIVRTSASSSTNAWDIPILSKLLSRNNIFWKLIYKIQFAYFKNKVQKGCEIMILAKKTV